MFVQAEFDHEYKLNKKRSGQRPQDWFILTTSSVATYWRSSFQREPFSVKTADSSVLQNTSPCAKCRACLGLRNPRRVLGGLYRPYSDISCPRLDAAVSD